jgi:hypothetical protein
MRGQELGIDAVCREGDVSMAEADEVGLPFGCGFCRQNRQREISGTTNGYN